MLAPAQKILVVRAGDHAALHAGVLEAQALDGVGQLDVDAQVVALLFNSSSVFAPPNGWTFMLNRATSPSTARIQWRYFEGWVSNCSFCAEAGVSIAGKVARSETDGKHYICLRWSCIMHYIAN